MTATRNALELTRRGGGTSFIDGRWHEIAQKTTDAIRADVELQMSRKGFDDVTIARAFRDFAMAIHDLQRSGLRRDFDFYGHHIRTNYGPIA
jgi:hypothetical protein